MAGTWTYHAKAKYPYTVKRHGGQVLINSYEDGSEHRRKKSGQVIREFTEVYRVHKADLEDMLDFFDEKLDFESFTKKTFDVTDADEATTTVRFASGQDPTYKWVGPNTYEISFTFIEVIGE